MEDRAASVARPGKATLRPGRGEVRMPGEASEEFTALLDPEVGSTSPAVKVIELQPPSGPPHVVVRAGKPAHRACLVELPCLAMTPRVRGLVLLNLVSGGSRGALARRRMHSCSGSRRGGGGAAAAAAPDARPRAPLRR